MHYAVYVQTNLGLFFNVHMLLGFACILPIMESMQSLLKFAQWGDIIIYDFIATIKICQG